jgi:hypothetical protein
VRIAAYFPRTKSGLKYIHRPSALGPTMNNGDMASMSARNRIGFDIGGTFTDFILLDQEHAKIKLHKCPALCSCCHRRNWACTR